MKMESTTGMVFNGDTPALDHSTVALCECLCNLLSKSPCSPHVPRSPYTRWARLSHTMVCKAIMIFKKNPRPAARTCRSKGWLRRSEKLWLTTKGRHEHDSRSTTIRFIVGISFAKGCVLCHRYEELTGNSFAALITGVLPAAFGLAQ